ncbi:MAG: type I-U CRISPR-associated helicase/endonuclease Cas3 [Myxococcales bacterium]|nr:type I-U CRISPR-associated helicase/endonuclease Cas3 [Myxococcales bacterium]
MSTFTVDDFSKFFEEIHRHPPFPWQQRLVFWIYREQRWPQLLDLPTGVGKTSALDIALFTFALMPDKLPRRTILVVDRRIVVDQAYDHACKISNHLRTCKKGTLSYHVATVLRDCFGGVEAEDPLHVAVLRGGMPQENSWAKTPDQPLLAASTVDQVGSRLLFRGYGVSGRMSPIHAGLIGNDTLILLDEVHLAGPFSQTLERIQHWRDVSGNGLPSRFQVVSMSATHQRKVDADMVFGLQEEDRNNPILAKRLRAHKRARYLLVKVQAKVAENGANRLVAEACVDEALKFVKQGKKKVGLIVNRVDTASMARELLGKHNEIVDSELLTGRMRPLDRDVILPRMDRIQAVPHGDRIDAVQPEERIESKPMILCATQCIEAGADFDFDALVTECASLDALRQRFGRLDRLGSQGDSEAVIVVRSDQVVEKANDPVYGGALAQTARWLREQSTIDFGIDHIQLPADLSNYLSPTLDAPVLLPAHLDAWVRTSPCPSPDPDVALWLHGPKSTAADVQVVWRADLDNEGEPVENWYKGHEDDPSLKGSDRTNNTVSEKMREMIGVAPPGTLEAISLPIQVVKAWLTGQLAPSLSDVIGEPGVDDGEQQRSHSQRTEKSRRVLRWMGSDSDDTQFIWAAEIRPGDTIVVPSRFGGIQFGNFFPASKEPVIDLGDIAQWRQRGRSLLRLHPQVLTPLFKYPTDLLPSVDEDTDNTAVLDFLDEITPRQGVASKYDVPGLLEKLRPRPKRFIRSPYTKTWTVLGRKRNGDYSDITTEGESGTFTAVEVPLHKHLRGVGMMAQQFATRLHLTPELVKDIALAGVLHDVGKADPRFQKMLVGGDPFRAALLAEPLAKSATPMRDVAARKLARQRAKYPPDARHELVSVALVADQRQFRAMANDWDLVLYLVASHHGWCRPFPPAAADVSIPVKLPLKIDNFEIQSESFPSYLVLTGTTDHGMARLDSGVAERFCSLVEKYGWWGLAWLETILRLADHRVSENEQNAKESADA